jgi:hypothetical protein
MSDAMETNPPVRWHTREDSGLRLDRELTWWHDGERLEHPNIVAAFNRGVQLADDGRVKLVFGNDWCFIEVEDCAYGVTGLEVRAGGLELTLSDGTAEPLEPMSLALSPHGFLTARVKQGRARARFSRPAHFWLAERLKVEGGAVVLEVGGAGQQTSLPVDALS